ncbi:MAG: ParB/RepB/Spo0J family partition protein [Thermoanaerobaculia bacterium]
MEPKRPTTKRGLPERARMRHDAHYVEELARRSSAGIGSLIPLSMIEVNPDQPRQSLGELEELSASIEEKGVLEPILVRSVGPNKYQIVSGERRFRAAEMAGLDEIPAIELDIDEREVIEIALIENMQRKDLTAFEESEGISALQQRFGYTHEKIAQVLSKSRTTVTESLLLAGIPEVIRELCVEHGISSKSVLVQIARAGSEEAMEELVLRLASGEIGRDELRKETRGAEPAKSAGRPRNFVFQLKDKSLPFSLNMTFKKAHVEKAEVVDALRELLKRLEKELDK